MKGACCDSRVDSLLRVVAVVLVGFTAIDAVSAERDGGHVAGTESRTQHRQRVNSIGMALVEIPAGEFFMGSDEQEINRLIGLGGKAQRADMYRSEGPQHRVRISKPFYFGRTSVTIGQFRQFVAATAYKTDAERDGLGGFGMVDRKWHRDPRYIWSSGAGFAATDQHPVVNVSWHDAVAFCEWLSKQEGVTYRLPTEAEWEYACRGGIATQPSDDLEQLDVTAWYRRNSDWRIHPVAEKRANLFGLYDMIGNIRNWCGDWFALDYYGHSPTIDPAGPATGANRVVRGSAFHADIELARSAVRYGDPPHHRHGQLGFRVVRAQQ
jgi:eukaryotic-like serine/threonine-protein kinase